MKLKTLLLALLATGLLVSAAVAATPAKKPAPAPSDAPAATTTDTTATTTAPGKSAGKAKGKKPECKPARKLVLKGEFVAAGEGGFALKVTGGNSAAKAWRDKQATVLVDDKTRFHGKKRSLAELAAGDRLTVQGFACRADSAAGSLLARKVGVKGPKGEDETTPATEPATTTTTTP